MRIGLNFPLDGIARKLILALIFFSTAITALITGVELYLDYRQDLSRINSRIFFIKESYLPTLAESVWVSDDAQIKTQLEGLVRLQDIEYLGIAIEGITRWSSGTRHSTEIIEESVPIFRIYRGKRVLIGDLQVVASVDNVYKRIVEKLSIIVTRNFLKTLLIAFFLLAVFHRIIGRHLQQIALHLTSIAADIHGTRSLTLQRKESGRLRPDALDTVVASINDMHRTIREDQREKTELAATLEKRVIDRTRDLEIAKLEAEKANRAKSEFLSRMSHELRTPMNAVLGFAQVMQSETLSEQHADYLAEIRRAGDHLMELIDELLDLSRIESGKMQLTLDFVGVQNVIRDAIAMADVYVRKYAIDLKIDCGSDFQVLADPSRLRQILVNLISNAAKYNRRGGEIIIRCEILGEASVRIGVSDTGNGISPENMEKLFRPFERLGAEKGAVQGTGIGLALSKQLTELMNGSLSVESKIGIGTTFWVDLPQARDVCQLPDGMQENALSQSDVDAPSSVKKILYIEDNQANIAVVAAVFRHRAGWKLLTANTGKAGLDIVKHEKPDVILLDIHLPEMDGYEVISLLKSGSETKNIPVIALTADAMTEEMEKGLRAGFKRYLTKPVNLDELLEAVYSVVSK